MKKILLLLLAAVAFAGCEKELSDGCKYVQFCLSGDFGSPTFTRSLTADGSEMTDVWVFDFVNDECVQFVHQEAEDEDFGTPSLTLANGAHNLCFVVSRGSEPAVDETTSTITWSRVSDTFWTDKEMTIGQGSASTVDVALARVATKLKITVNDKVPENISKMSITPATWYYGLNYWLGEPAAAKNNEKREVTVPANRIGTSGVMNMSVFGISGKTEWTTDVVVSASDANGAEIGHAEITAAPFIANRQTGYSGTLFSKDGAFNISLTDAWQTGFEGEW